MNEIKDEETELLKDKEIELKVKLEDIVILAENVINLSNEVYALYRKIEMEKKEELRLLCQGKKKES